MKTLEWQKFLLEQKRVHGKAVFTVAELANVAQADLHGLNTELGRLVARGVIGRYGRGLYGMPDAVTTEELVAAIDAGAYTTGLVGLFGCNLVTQVPAEVTCFTNRRHNRNSDRQTPAGRLRFVHVPSRIYAKPLGTLVAGEQALCDYVWLTLREGLDPRSLVTFRNLASLDRKRLGRLVARYPKRVGQMVTELTKSVEAKQKP